MLDLTQLDKILFLDIETVPEVYNYSDLELETTKLFDSKNARYLTEEKTKEDVYNEKAGIYAEFGKIVCISVGFVHQSATGKSIRMTSFAHDDEETLLRQFVRLLENNYNTPKHVLCGHNSKEFDLPFICRRLLINGIALPNILNLAGKKPWEILHLDTMELWKFGDYKAYTSLALLCHIFKIPTPKDDISGADVARVYYEEQNLDRIRIYCEKDVVALIQLFLRMNGESLVDEGEIYIK
ncbi:3'-5' exonuclease [Fluviicola taffensis]|uniref:3'-5' exonuclease, PolB n=1 Tax=Fluviicola taffensis (strain DSM 16823 / NCIMB 13979 / RW262) TaxID=755732 RepID=F2IBC8_FLUTR|nr:3'-5' exonuclease [Fluviicola taffensis]AEA43214.1 3'-5' exonuclease, PolB [Fluviicola taffensis DSM 16823]